MLSTTASQVLTLYNDETCDAQKLSELLQRDQSLAGHVLGVANSAAYAPKEPIVSLQQAVSRLGITAICEIAIAVSLKGRVFEVPGQKVKIRQMWMHSAAAGVYAKEVTRRLRSNVEGAFMCGLLHDVGRPIVMQTLIDLAKERTEKVVPAGILEAAQEEFHERVGAMLIQRWELTDWMSDVIAHHHDYRLVSEHKTEAMVTHLADVLSHWALDDDKEEEDFDRDDPVIADLNLYDDDIDALLALRGRVLEVTEAFL